MYSLTDFFSPESRELKSSFTVPAFTFCVSLPKTLVTSPELTSTFLTGSGVWSHIARFFKRFPPLRTMNPPIAAVMRIPTKNPRPAPEKFHSRNIRLIRAIIRNTKKATIPIPTKTKLDEGIDMFGRFILTY